jgi:hypothetical protein
VVLLSSRRMTSPLACRSCGTWGGRWKEAD